MLIGFLGLLIITSTCTIAFLLRAYKLELNFEGFNHQINFSTSYFSIGANFVINDLTHGKVGDIAKIFIIKDQKDINLSKSVVGISYLNRMLMSLNYRIPPEIKP